jgi:hypothetical protein
MMKNWSAGAPWRTITSPAAGENQAALLIGISQEEHPGAHSECTSHGMSH